MLSIKSFSSGKSGSIANYITGNGAENYYGTGYWGGEGAKQLGLDGALEKGELENLLAGRNPKTGEAITQKVDDAHKPGWDLTFSAPKSVSLAFVAIPELRGQIMEAHEAAVGEAMNYMEREAFFTRHGHDGVDKVPVLESGGITYSVHHHLGSRENDPDLHSHVPTANMTAAGRAIDLDTRQKMVGGAIYRVELADRLKSLGLAIERDGTSFKIAGVDKALCDEYSKSGNAIKAQMETNGLSGAESAAKVASTIRKDKSEETAQELIQRVEPELKAKGLSLESLQAAAKQLESNPLILLDPKQIIDELTFNESTVSELQLKAASIQASQGHHSASQALSHHEAIVSKDQSIVYLQSSKGLRATSEEVIQREVAMLNTSERMASKTTHVVAPEQLLATDKWDSLKPEQKEAVAHLTTGADLVILQGWAGTGKTYALGVAVEALQKSGYEVVAAAPSNKAVDELRKGAGIDHVINTTKLEMQIDSGQIVLNPKTVLIIDEAGMEGSRRIGNLLQQAEAAGAKVILQGDTKQLQAVEAGAAMRGIIEKVGSAELGHESVTRQKNNFDREIAKDIREGRAHEAVGKLEKNGNVSVHKDKLEAHKGAADAYLKDLGKGKDSILVAFTRSEVNHLNQSVREVLKENGAIDKTGQQYKTASGSREFTKGDKVIFGEKNQFEKGNDATNVINGSRGTVQAVAENAVYVKLDKSQEIVKVEPDKFNKIDHGYATTVHKSQGASTDTAHVVVGDRSSQEWAYVAVSRHKEELTIHTTKEVVEREKMPETGKEKSSIIEETFSRSGAKDLSTDYIKVDPPSQIPPAPGQSTKDNNLKPNPNQQAERSQALPKEQPLKTNEKDKPKEAEAAKETPQQRLANTQKLNEAIKNKAIAAVQKVEAIKEIHHKITVEKVSNKGNSLEL